MFLIGDIIFYPVFGAGYILNIEDRKIHGEIKKYYIIKFMIDDMSSMIPVYSREASRMRKAITKDECMTVFQILHSPGEELPEKWNARCRIYNESIREGNIFKLSTVLRDVALLSKNKELSRSEQKVFREILNMVGGEIALVSGVDFGETIEGILSTLNVDKNIIP